MNIELSNHTLNLNSLLDIETKEAYAMQNISANTTDKIILSSVMQKYDEKENKYHIIPLPENNSVNINNVKNFMHKSALLGSDTLALLNIITLLELEMKKYNRNAMHLQRIESFEKYKEAAEKMRCAAKLIMAGAVIGGTMSLISGVCALKMSGFKMGHLSKSHSSNKTNPLIKQINKKTSNSGTRKNPNQNTQKEFLNSFQPINRANGVTFKKPSQIRKVAQDITSLNALHNANNATVSSNNALNKASQTSEGTNRNTSINSNSTTSAKTNALINNPHQIYQNQIHLMDQARYTQIIIDSAGKIISSIPQLYGEMTKSEQAKIEALASLKNTLGSNEEQYYSSISDTISKLHGQVNGIIESSLETSKAMIRG